TTLDGEERELKATDLVIADGDRAIALAGVMGGEDTEVSDKTQTVVLEAAVFNSSKIRKTARRENLHSEASQRFERGINVATVQEALDAAAQMIAEFGDGQVVSGILEINHVDPENVDVEIIPERINKVLGTDLTDEAIVGIFEQLGFGVAKDETGTLTVSVPPRRWDIAIQADLIEEVARIYGYDNIPTTLPTMPLTEGHYTKAQKIIRDARAILKSAGLSQAIRSEEHTSELQSRFDIVCRLLLDKKKN